MGVQQVQRRELHLQRGLVPPDPRLTSSAETASLVFVAANLSLWSVAGEVGESRNVPDALINSRRRGCCFTTTLKPAPSLTEDGAYGPVLYVINVRSARDYGGSFIYSFTPP